VGCAGQLQASSAEKKAADPKAAASVSGKKPVFA